MTNVDYSDVTERPGLAISSIQLARAIHRYQTAAKCATGRKVLEVACGSGQGLGILADAARSVVGGDYSASNLGLARQQYVGRLPLVQLDAGRLPFCAESFDVVVLLEAIYYLEDPARFVAEAKRILRRPGRIVISTVNCAWPDFGKSPHASVYFDANQLRKLLSDVGWSARIFGAFPEGGGTRTAAIRSAVRRIAFRLNMVPGSLRARAVLKRLVYGPLLRLPAELDPEIRVNEPLVEIPPGVRDTTHSILYALATDESD
jgi:SAM-dependent methyltransferase